jgi:rhamnosyltransferase
MRHLHGAVRRRPPLPPSSDYAKLRLLLPRAPTVTSAISAVVITHHPDAGVAARLRTVAAQVGRLIVVDNGSAAGARAALAPECGELIANAENLGVARALNLGVMAAAARGFEWCLLLDQDSVPDADMVAGLLAVLAHLPDHTRVALLGCAYRLPGAPTGAAAAVQDVGCDEVESVITSGSLLSLAAFRAVGPFRDELFIDYVDVDYCRRARAAGFRVLETRRRLMTHSIGAPTEHRFLWMRKWTTNHSADRRYYIARNQTVLLQESARHGPVGSALKSLGRCVRTAKRIILYESDKYNKLYAVSQGWWDGIHGLLGPRRRPAACGSRTPRPPPRPADGS